MKWRHVLLACVVLSLAACRRSETLLTSLDQQQANEVAAVLLRHDIAAEKVDAGKAGYTIKVDTGDFPSAVDWLKTYDLPSRPRMEIAQMFPPDALVASPRAERARLYSAIEQRLEQSLRLMNGVLAARVHLSYDVEGLAMDQAQTAPHVAAVAVYQKGVDPSVLINDVKRFLKNSIDDVRYENISVVLSPQPDALDLPAPPPVSRSNGSSNTAFWTMGLIALLLAVATLIGVSARVLARSGKPRVPAAAEETL
ncbi:EscJ/YscJ/HrcJ family type III secretion inner membrane ring protein [Pandoraea pneumonica]|uniref:EscJ/YscJ/HrcJ family type III secretion inner membrane ring protein n=1 Tax=Pandoraea pneumonica TaxID=2508299 RepID=UPI003CE863F5